MALSSILSAAGHAPESLRTNARIQLRNIGGAPTLARIDLDVDGQVANVDQQQFQATQRRPSGSARCHARWPASPRLP
jgi:osmotically inducible protein OsmC